MWQNKCSEIMVFVCVCVLCNMWDVCGVSMDIIHVELKRDIFMSIPVQTQEICQSFLNEMT